MKFIIIGAGDVGTSLCTKLAAHEHDVVLIEKNQENVSHSVSSLDIQVLIGNGASPEILTQAQVDKADYVIAVTDSDEVNIATCFISRLMAPHPKRIARVRDIELVTKSISPELLSEYFDLIINPEQAGAEYMLQIFKTPGAREIVEFSNGKVRVLGIQVTAESPLLDVKLKSLRELGYNAPVLILALMRAERLIVPKGDDKVKVGDVMYAVTTPDKTKLLFELAGRELHEGRSAMIWGGSTLARILAHELESQGTRVKLIIKDHEAASQMADELQDTLILHGEGTDQNLLNQEGISDMDAFVAASPDEENNILASLLAKKLGARVCMALVSKATYTPLVSAIGVDVVISSRLAAASAIFRHIHSRSIISEFLLQQETAGFIEIDLSPEIPICGSHLKNLKLPYGVLIVAILRGDEAIIPSGEDMLLAGDRAVIFVIKAALKKLEGLLDIKLELFG